MLSLAKTSDSRVKVKNKTKKLSKIFNQGCINNVHRRAIFKFQRADDN
jgi:hypothetical protein